MGLFSKRRRQLAAAHVEETTEAPAEEPVEPSAGPYDDGDSYPDIPRLDAGALRIPLLAGCQVNFGFDQTRQEVVSLALAMHESQLQMWVVAAPKSRDLWPNVKADLVSNIAAQGGSSQMATGPWGEEVHATMPIGSAGGLQPVRYLGIDGPRWLMRISLAGRGALNQEEGDAFLHAVLDNTVVVRGPQAAIPEQMLPLRVPTPAEIEKIAHLA